MKSCLPFLLTPLFYGCAYKPTEVLIYDHDCGVVSRHLELERTQTLSLAQCESEECIGGILLIGAVNTATTIVSGTVVVAANTAHWIEKQADCL